MIYLDHNSTTLPIDEVRNIILENSKMPLNPSSLYSWGRAARNKLEEARTRIADALSIKLGRGGYKIVFTSGGTESNNLIINSFRNKMIMFSGIEHASVKKPARNIENSVELKVKSNGVIDLDFLAGQLKKHTKSEVLVSVMAANNETGVIQPLESVLAIAREYGALVHSDATQALGKIPFNLSELPLDAASFSSHKLGGPHGIGILVIRDDIVLSPLLYGGGQEMGARSGTENTVAALGFAAAIDTVVRNIEQYKKIVQPLREYVEKEIIQSGFGSVIAERSERLPNTVLLASRYLNSDLQLIQYDLQDIAVSSGSACSSGKVRKSEVLKSMGFDAKLLPNVIRVSFGIQNTLEDAKRFVSAWNAMHLKHQEFKGIV